MSRPALVTETRCSIARTLEALGEKWSLLIQGDSRYSEFRERLGIPTDVLAARLATLVDAGILERRSYREPGARERNSYHLTDAGRELKTVLAALNQWGSEHRPTGFGEVAAFADQAGEAVKVEFVTASGARLDFDEVEIVPGPASIGGW
jgi:DNA-binding HxlR family transcriptional regulator